MNLQLSSSKEFNFFLKKANGKFLPTGFGPEFLKERDEWMSGSKKFSFPHRSEELQF